MREMKKKLLKIRFCLITVLLIGLFQSAIASPEQERVYLLQLIHQIDAMKPNLLAAQQEQSKTARVQFHYTLFQDAQGKKHNGIWEDLQAIRAGIKEKIKNKTNEPRTPEGINGDYMDKINQEPTP
jgi:RAQPRD family integrative conjugative element protein